MFRIISIMVVLLMSISLFTGCARNDMTLYNTPQSKGNWAEQTNANDVDTSDLDESITESEMMMTEESSENIMKRDAFPTSEYYHLAREGKGTVKGKIYLKDGYGRAVAGVGTRLYLNPVTSYSKQWYTESYLGGREMEKADARLFNYLKFTAADSNGKFEFYGVPSGDYYLIGTVKCGQECGYASEKNIRIATRLSISGNQIIEQDLTRMTE